jgi:hypothetical protein
VSGPSDAPESRNPPCAIASSAARFYVDARPVDRGTFSRLFCELDVDDSDPVSTADIEQEDGRYAGQEASFDAVHRRTGASYIYTVIDLVEDGRPHTELRIDRRRPE